MILSVPATFQLKNHPGRPSSPPFHPLQTEDIGSESPSEKGELPIEESVIGASNAAEDEFGGPLTGTAERFLIRGVVLDADSGLGISGVVLWVDDSGEGAARPLSIAAHTGRGGQFTALVTRRPGMRLDVRLRDPRYYLVSTSTVGSPDSSVEAYVQLFVRPWTYLRLQVTSGSGSALAGARVDWLCQVPGGESRGQTETDSEGWAQVPMDDGRLWVTAVTPGFQRGFLEPMESRRGRWISPAHLLLNKASPVFGRLLEESGHGVPGVVVEFLPLGGIDQAFANRFRGGLVDDTVMTDEGGEFVLRSISPESAYHLKTPPSSFPRWRVDGFVDHIDQSYLILRASRP